MVVRRLAWLGLGFGSVALGLVGVFLPLVPTTPFLLLAAFGFARSSPRLHAWLVEHPRHGAAIRDWHRHRAIGRRAKAAAALAMLAAFGASVLAGLPAGLLAVQAAVLLAVAAFLLTRPAPPDPASGRE